MKNMTGESIKQLMMFCKNVRLLRKLVGCSQKEMAKRLGISVKSLSKIEKGQVPPRLSCLVLFIIQHEFGVEPTRLLKCSLCERDISTSG